MTASARVALVAGAARGQGAAIVRRLKHCDFYSTVISHTASPDTASELAVRLPADSLGRG
jgi:NAD(P)-dependent dehydrogenase (short-subunit alcohol dehydrogenase family)